MAARTGVEPQMLYNDDGIMLRCHDADEIPLDLFAGLIPEEVEGMILEDILHAPLFGGQFRQNAGRALLMPRAMPGQTHSALAAAPPGNGSPPCRAPVRGFPDRHRDRA